MKNFKQSGVLIPGFLLLGLGIGMILDQVAAGAMIGLGLGFIGMYLGKII